MKKILLLITLFILPVMVNANSFKYDDELYVFEEKTIECVGEEDILIGVTKNEEYIFGNAEGEDEIYKIDKDDKCVDLTVDDLLEFSQYNIDQYILHKNDNGKYIIKTYREDPETFFIKTNDTKVVEGKTYYEVGEGWFGTVTPTDETISNYYESVVLLKPASSTIDSNVTYYKQTDNYLIYDKVENPVSKDILDYFVINEFNEKKFDVLNSDNFKKIENIDELIEKREYDIIPNEDETEFYIMFTINNKRVYFDVNGNEIKEFDNAYELVFITSDIVGLSYSERMDLYSKDLELLYTSKDYGYIVQVGYSNYRHFLDLSSNISKNNNVVYHLDVYKILEGNNQIYNNEDLVFKTSGRLEKLSKVEINGKEIDAKNYTLKSGSTIITLNNDYLKTLSKGEYDLKLTYSDGGYNNITFKVNEKKEEQVVLPENPETGDGIALTIVGVVVSLVGICGVVMIMKKD